MTPGSKHKEPPPGLPEKGEPGFLAVGKLRRTHGVQGELQMEVLTDFPERLKPGTTVFLEAGYQPLQIRSVRNHGQALLVAFEGYPDLESAVQLRNQLVFVSSADRPPLPEGEYYHHQLLGLRVLADTGEVLGRLSEILTTGANDVYIIKAETGAEILLPATQEVIRKIDLERGEMRVHLLPGLLPQAGE